MYELKIERRAVKFLKKVEKKQKDAIVQAIEALRVEPRPHGAKKLADRPGFRIRIGQYRIIYVIEEKEVLIYVLDIGHRKNIYR